MNDRRPLIAIALILLISVAPMFWRKAPPPRGAADSLASAVQAPPQAAPQTAPAAVAPAAVGAADSSATGAPLPPAQLIPVRSALYRYGISTRGGQIVSARFLRYHSMAAGDTLGTGRRDTLELLRPEAPLLTGRLLLGPDTVRLDQVAFTASTDSLAVAEGGANTLTLTGQSGPYTIELRYRFAADDYHIGIEGEVRGLAGSGGTLLVGLGEGFRETEADIPANDREGGIVTKLDATELTRFGSLTPGQSVVLPGPFEWVAVKSKYFVAGFFAYDSTAAAGARGLIGGVQATVRDATTKTPVRAEVAASLVVPASGNFGWTLFLGPMEYDRLTAMGHDFDDVNPYGWPGFRTVIRPFAVAIRTFFVWLHTTTGFGYGSVIVLFGILVRILLWPLNQKAMRSMTAMQAIQPQLTALQAKYKEDPQKQQAEMFKLYKENKVNPFGGCWPMLLPYPLLVAVFFVLANTIELRGVPFLWMTDLSRFDPLYIIPVIMAVSMYAVSKIGMMGLPPNPQSKMMLYLMPVMMLVLFARFAAGLNLYYAVQNLVSLPQQWLIMRERRKLMPKPAPAVEVKTKGR